MVSFQDNVLMTYTKQTLRDLLTENVAQVTFLKVDGTERQIKCTLMPSLLPSQKETSTNKKKENEEVLPVWDLNKNAFRSFRVKSVLCCSLVKEY